MLDFLEFFDTPFFQPMFTPLVYTIDIFIVLRDT
jgi:hypothetical protein